MEVTVTAFLLAERNVKVDHGLEEPRKKGKEPSEIRSGKSVEITSEWVKSEW